MSYVLIIRRRAESHIVEAHDWYEKQKTGLGAEFLLSIDAIFSLLQQSPNLFQEKYKNIRCALVPRFPYGIFYFVDGNKIIVISVFHLSRNPKMWKK